jgi:hypothetical protein
LLCWDLQWHLGKEAVTGATSVTTIETCATTGLTGDRTVETFATTAAISQETAVIYGTTFAVVIMRMHGMIDVTFVTMCVTSEATGAICARTAVISGMTVRTFVLTTTASEELRAFGGGRNGGRHSVAVLFCLARFGSAGSLRRGTLEPPRSPLPGHA